MADYKNIVPLARNGDPKALEELYKSTSRAVYFTCMSFVKKQQDAEDLTQNTYITAFQKLKTLQQPEKFEPWIKRIAVNLCKDFLRKKSAHPTQPLNEQVNYETVDENFLPEEYVTAAEKRGIVMKIMRDDLSDVLYQTVIMFYFDEMSVATIAQEMNCPEGTVKYRLNAARAKIRQGVLGYEKKSGDKLYAFAGLSGLPFLARLLTAESNAANVPVLDIMSAVIQKAPYVSDPTAVDPGFTADFKINTGGKMLGTLKAKIIAGVAAAAVVGGGTAAVIAVANNSRGNESGYTSSIDTMSNSQGSSSDDWGSAVISTVSDNMPEPVPEDYEYVDIEGGIRITKYNGSDEYLTVPAEIDGKKVLEIDNEFEHNMFIFYDFEREVKIKEITLPDGLTRIGNSAFAHLSELKTIHIPESVTILGSGAFTECTSLENVTLPEGLTRLSYTFDGCKSLSEITIPESVKELFDTFENCTSLTHITLPKNVEEIDYAFEGCTNLKEVIFLGNELESIGLSTFKNCTSLESIVIPEGIEYVVESAFSGCTSLKSVTLPESLEEIEATAFENCTSLKEITLPDDILTVEPGAFEGCTDIKIIYKGMTFSPEEISVLLGSIDQ